MSLKDDMNLASRYPYSFPPSAVACSRGRLDSQTYDAELSFDGQHYVVSSGHPDHAAAKAAAQTVVDELLVTLRNAAKPTLARYKVAQP